MGYQAGALSIGTDATPVCPVGPGGILVHNSGDAPLTLGGADVSWEQGLVIAAGEKLFIPGEAQAYEGNSGSVVIGAPPPATTGDVLTLYACSLSGGGKISYIAP